MKPWLRVSRWACDCCRCARASSKVIPAGSDPSCSPPPSSLLLFLLFSPSWRRALVARFITSDLAWMLSWGWNGGLKEQNGGGGGEGGGNCWGGGGRIEQRDGKRKVQKLWTFISKLTCWREAGITRFIWAKIPTGTWALCVWGVCVSETDCSCQPGVIDSMQRELVYHSQGERKSLWLYGFFTLSHRSTEAMTSPTHTFTQKFTPKRRLKSSNSTFQATSTTHSDTCHLYFSIR